MTNCFRVFQKVFGDKLDYAIDKYNDAGIIQLYNEKKEEEINLQKDEIISQYKFKSLYLKKRTLKPETIFLGGQKIKKPFLVVENGLYFSVRVEEHLDVGLFLDHRISRELISSYAANKNVLNLFSYTGSFSVYCAKAKAKSTTSVDLSKTYCKWANENFELNSFKTNLSSQITGEVKNFIYQADVFDFISEAKSISQKYDIIILDPPTFSRNKGKNFSVQKDHKDLIRDIQKYLLSDGGFLFFSTNKTDFILDPYLRPGADPLTKKTVPKEFLPFKPHLSYVFYN